jgi:uncharacterized protein
LVNDFAGVLSAEQQSSLENKLVAFNKETSNQIVVVTVASLGDYEPAAFSFKLGNKWGIGREKLRNGILILIKVKTSAEKGRAFIATGRGLEGAIPDATCFAIVNKEMIPKFKENDYYGGIDAATNVLMGLAKGEFNYSSYSKKSDDNQTYIIIALIVIGFFVLINFRRKGQSKTINGRTYYDPWWGGFGGGSSWGDSGSSSDSGGFDGFGGGDFGGGGAGGDW